MPWSCSSQLAHGSQKPQSRACESHTRWWLATTGWLGTLREPTFHTSTHMGDWDLQLLLYEGATQLWGTFFKLQVEITNFRVFLGTAGATSRQALNGFGRAA